MKYLAILRDSLREVLDSKVFYVMLALSGVVILGVASVSFEYQPAEEGVRRVCAGMLKHLVAPGITHLPLTGPLVRYKVEQFEQLNPGAVPWHGQYRFVLAARPQRPAGQEKEAETRVDALRLLVLWDNLARNRGEGTGEDEASRRRLTEALQQAQRLSFPEREPFLARQLEEELGRVSPAQMEEFIRRQLAAQAALDEVRVRLEPARGDETRFTVEAQGGPETYRTWPTRVILFFGGWTWPVESTVGFSVYTIEDFIVCGIGAGVAMFLSTFITASFIPSMLRKGTIDLLLSKPIYRPLLLVYKYIGGLSFMFLNTVVIVVGVWVMLGLRSGLWAPGFLLSIVILTYEFAIFYAVSTLFGVLTRSSIVSILMSCLAWVALFAVGNGYVFIDDLRRNEAHSEVKIVPRWGSVTADILHVGLPHYKDLDALNGEVLARDLLGPNSEQLKDLQKISASSNWSQVLGVTTGWIALLVGLACWRFAVKDY
jgi:hypothetical protein